MENIDAQKCEQLSEELQAAAIRLMNHMQTTQARIRIKGALPELYITLGEGRCSGNESDIVRQAQDADIPLVQEPLVSSAFAKLRKVLVA